MEGRLPLLFSEKVILAAKAYRLSKDPFTGLMSAHLNRFVQLERLNQAYQKTVQDHTSFNLYFKKTEGLSDFPYKKEKLPPALSDIKIFRGKKSFLLWKQAPLPESPLQEMAVYKTWRSKTLVFKFHHLILDGRSLFYFFDDLSKYYLELSGLNSPQQSKRKNESSAGLTQSLPPPPRQKEKSEFEVYQKLMEDFFLEEKRNRLEKTSFWKERINDFKKDSSKQEDSNEIPALKEMTGAKGLKGSTGVAGRAGMANSSGRTEEEEHIFDVKLSRLQLRRLAQEQKRTDIKLPYLLFSLYSKALWRSFQIEDVILRTAFSARHNLTDSKEKRLIASLSRSAPLFIKKNSLSIPDLATALQKQIHSLKKHLILDKSPFDFNELKSYSKEKNDFLSLSMSYFFYREENFLGCIKSFSWQSYFLDLVLFIILSEKTFLLSFSYNPNKFSKQDLKKLSKEFSKQIKQL